MARFILVNSLPTLEMDREPTSVHQVAKSKGEWSDDMNVDQATATDGEGIKWFGTFKNLKPQGFMKVRLPNGQKYDGVWTDGQMQRAFSVRNRRNAETVYHFR